MGTVRASRVKRFALKESDIPGKMGLRSEDKARRKVPAPSAPGGQGETWVELGDKQALKTAIAAVDRVARAAR
jgi:hypothetical protein